MTHSIKTQFKPGKTWCDSDGIPIQAHGGSVLFDKGIYYWFGENKDGETYKAFFERVDVIGISCYSSKDLLNWKNEGIVLAPVKDDPSHDLHTSKVVERPKVIYNEKTKKYVMWVHIDTLDYEYARVGVAVSDSPIGPYSYLKSIRPNGADSRDMTVFKDDDGNAYLIHSSEWNKTMYIARLNDEYVDTTGEYTRNFEGESREAPVVFKHNNRYYMITSYCTGWEPNEALYAVADSIMGPWKIVRNPCVGSNSQLTFLAQGTYVLPVQNKENTYIFMSDQWNPKNLRDSKYVWLPLYVNNEGVTIKWIDSWEIDDL